MAVLTDHHLSTNEARVAKVVEATIRRCPRDVRCLGDYTAAPGITIGCLVVVVVITHRKTWLSLSSDGTSARKRGAIIGGLGAFTGSLLLQASIPAGVAGLGLLFLGTAGTIADFDE